MKLKDICKINSGKSIKACFIRDKDINHNIPCYGGNGLRGFVSSPNQTGGNPIIGRVGAQCGNIHYCDEPFYATEHALVVTLNDSNVNPQWLCRKFESMKLGTYAEGAAQPVIAASKLLQIEISIPSLSEQQSIVDYLDSAFAKIDAMKANAEKALNEAKALFQASLKEMLEPKEGWEEKKLGDVCQIKGGKRLPKGYILSSEPMSHRYITVADFTKNGTVVPSTVKYISDEVYKTIQRYTITSDDVYVTIVGSTVGKAGIIPPELDGANLTENACKLVLNNDNNKRFVYYLMCSEYVIKQEQLLTKVSAQPKLALNRLASIVVYIPSLSEQQSIIETLDSIKSKVDRLQENFDKISQECDSIKQALLKHVFNEE